MNFREMRAKLISTYGSFVFFPDNPEIDKIISTKAFTHLLVGEEITVYTHKIMEEQIEEELQEDYNVIYGEPELNGEYFVSPYAKIENLNFKFKNGVKLLKKALRKPFDEELEIIKNFSMGIGEALQRAWEKIEIGMSSKEFKRIIDCEILKHADGFLYPTIVTVGKESKHPLPRTGEKKIEEGKIIYVDSSPILNGYPLNFSRVIFTEENERWIDALERINEMYHLLGESLSSGVKCDELDSLVRKIGNFPHYSAVPSGGFYMPYAPGDCILEENSLVTIVPSIYLEEGVIRVKRNIIVKKFGVEFLV